MKPPAINAQPTAASLLLAPSRKTTMRWLIPFLLVLLFLLTLIWLPRQAQQMEASERLEQLIADSLWVEQAIRFQLSRDDESMRIIGREIVNNHLHQDQFRARINALLRNNREFYRVTWLNVEGKPVASSDDFPISRSDLSEPSRMTEQRARQMRRPLYSPPAVPPGIAEPTLMDYHVPMFRDNHYVGSLVASYAVVRILNEMVPWWFAQDNEISLTDTDDSVIARRTSGGPGLNVYTHRRELELPGLTLVLHTNSTKSAPKLLPNLLVGSVIVLSLGLLWSLWALWRDINRRTQAEGALWKEAAFRAAMENSLITGMRARDLQGRITYVNPAFCKMVGIAAEQLVGKIPPMPYWAPEAIDEYQERFSNVLAGRITPQFETIFQRSNGERFPVLIFEAPLVDQNGKQTGWMGSILDISERKRAEDLNRTQEEKLQASARLASMGEIASTLAHELNQPLGAISSYATGALNMVKQGSLEPAALTPALEKIHAQAQRAGHVIRSVHQFVRKREPARSPLQIKQLIDNVTPLIELQAQQFFVVLQTQVPVPLPDVLGDAVLLEQVILNLTRNGIQAMTASAPERRILRIVAEVDRSQPGNEAVLVSVIDQGHGIAEDVAARLFSPFFSTKAEGMGMGLNICRTTIEFHGGTLTYTDNPAGGTIFRFSLPALGAATA
ncbi:PAS domain-containing sensor histidine kinase [Herbaspirillum sp. alder98]|uniref:PAS domain-containing sensor histidine kinase n=1 Tax=Herbaspirillum sp. alder98 TaxID=2913096 RepID=UPI001CD9076D|nr:PAS domain-containing sensor histidine kinase [Herbaspirillum sp. alder98]MCA1325153.1 PAS domain S-box protein [Herbaspirillum sp. alder98]